MGWRRLQPQPRRRRRTGRASRHLLRRLSNQLRALITTAMIAARTAAWRYTHGSATATPPRCEGFDGWLERACHGGRSLEDAAVSASYLFRPAVLLRGRAESLAIPARLVATVGSVRVGSQATEPPLERRTMLPLRQKDPHHPPQAVFLCCETLGVEQPEPGPAPNDLAIRDGATEQPCQTQ